MNNSGKLTFTGMVVIALIFFGGYISVQLITSAITKGEIAKQVKDRLGKIRGFSLTNDQAEEHIYKILSKQKGIIFGKSEWDAISVRIDNENRTLSYYFEYGMETNFIFYKKRNKVQVKDSMRSFR